MAVVVTSAIVLLMVLLAIGSYNRLLGRRRKVLDGWRQVDLQLRRRHEVVRKLLTSVRGPGTSGRCCPRRGDGGPRAVPPQPEARPNARKERSCRKRWRVSIDSIGMTRSWRRISSYACYKKS